MRRRLALVALLPVLAACGASPLPVAREAAAGRVASEQPAPVPPEPSAIAYVDPDREAMADAESHAAPGGRRVLETAGSMIDEDVVIVGSCWDWAHTVFTRAGGDSRSVFRGRQLGPFADTALFAPGDWLYFNHTDGGGTHSAIFVAWADEPAHIALTVSYGGGHVESAGRYSTYDVSQVFRLVRMDD